jgi:hypothetical protein
MNKESGNVSIDDLIKERMKRLRRQYRLDCKPEYRHKLAELDLLRKKIKEQHERIQKQL